MFDGPDGCGKSTVRDRVADHLRAAGLAVTTCKDPGGTTAGDRIRSVLLDHDLSDMTVQCETLLFMASRGSWCGEVVRPALKEGHVVLCDRFVSSTCAYQVAAGDDLATILELAGYAIGNDVAGLDAGAGCAGGDRVRGSASGIPFAGIRNSHRQPAWTPWSVGRRSFHAAVRANFLRYPVRYPSPVEILDATQELDAVVEEALDKLHRLALQAP